MTVSGTETTLRQRVAETVVVILGLTMFVGVMYLALRQVQDDQAGVLLEIDEAARAIFDDFAAAPEVSEQAVREALRWRDAELKSFSTQDGRTEFTILMHRTAASGGEKLQHFRRCFTYTLPASGTPSYRKIDCPDISPGESWKYIG